MNSFSFCISEEFFLLSLSLKIFLLDNKLYIHRVLMCLFVFRAFINVLLLFQWEVSFFPMQCFFFLSMVLWFFYLMFVLWNLLIICFRVLLFMFLVVGVHWDFCICVFTDFIKFRKFLAIITSNSFCLPGTPITCILSHSKLSHSSLMSLLCFHCVSF